MAIFFLLVGLELKREVMRGELSRPSKVVLPVAAAIGGNGGPGRSLCMAQHRQRRGDAGLGDPDGDRHRLRARRDLAATASGVPLSLK
jgi:Na+/H+ antiporter NhaA